MKPIDNVLSPAEGGTIIFPKLLVLFKNIAALIFCATPPEK